MGDWDSVGGRGGLQENWHLGFGVLYWHKQNEP